MRSASSTELSLRCPENGVTTVTRTPNRASAGTRRAAATWGPPSGLSAEGRIVRDHDDIARARTTGARCRRRRIPRRSQGTAGTNEKNLKSMEFAANA